MKFNNFNNVENKMLRTWNRCAMFVNIWQDHDLQKAKDYAAQFNKEDMVDMYAMFDNIKLNGYEQMRALVNRNVQKENLH